MKAIHLLRAAAAVSAVAGADRGRRRDVQHRRRRRIRRLQDGTAPPSPQLHVTCAADETPCGDEVGHTMACAPGGGTCPCYLHESRCSDPRFGEYCDTVCCEWGKEE